MDKKKTEFKEAKRNATYNEAADTKSAGTYLPTSVKEGIPLSNNDISVSAAENVTDKLKLAKNSEVESNSNPVKDFFKEERISALMQNKKVMTGLVFAILQFLLLVQMQSPQTFMMLGDRNGGYSVVFAEACYREALFLSPQNAEAAAKLARCALYRNDYPSAENYAHQSLQIKSNTLAYNVLGEISLVKSEFEKARDYIEASLKLTPSAPIEVAELGWAKKRLGDTKGSLKLYQEATKLKTDVAIDFHHFGYGVLNPPAGQQANPSLALISEDLAIDLHVEKIDPLREWYAHMNKAKAYNLLFEPTKAASEARFVISGCKDRETISWAYEDLLVSDQLAADYAALKSDAKAQAKFEKWSDNYGVQAEVSYFQKDYVSALKYADLRLKENSDFGDWANLYREMSLKALKKNADFTEVKQTFEDQLETSVVDLKAHHLDKRASDLQGVLNLLKDSK